MSGDDWLATIIGGIIGGLIVVGVRNLVRNWLD